MLVAVLMTALLLLPAVLTAVAIGEANNANQAVAHDSALAAAEAGIADYTNALNYNSGSSGYQTLNASNSTYAAFGGSGGTPTWEPVNGAPNECYFYETTAVSGSSDSITVTGRYGPSAIANGVCKSKAGIHYEYKTLAVTVQPVESNPYLYSNQYQAPNPFVYGAFSGGPNACGYYAYGQNNSWGYMDVGLSANLQVSTYSLGPWNLYGQATALSGYGPTEAGALFGSNGGWSTTFLGIVTFDIGFNQPAEPFWGFSPFTNANSPSAGNWSNWNFAYNAYPTGQGGPNGCGLFGSPYHDGFWTNADSFNGGSAGTKIYTSDEYYVCNTYAGDKGPTFSANVTLESGDPYTSATAPTVPSPGAPDTELNPGIDIADSWPLGIGTLSITWFGLLNQNAWTTGPPIPSSDFMSSPAPYTNGPYYIPADSGTLQMAVLLGTWTWAWWLSWIGGPYSFGWGWYSIPVIQLCNPTPSSLASGSNDESTLDHISQVSPQLPLPFTTPSTGQTQPDYTLSSVENDAASNGGCVYSGGNGFNSVAIDFGASGNGAQVTLGAGSSVVSGTNCTGSNVSPPSKVFFVEDGDAQVEGTVNSKYTVAVASTSVTSGCSSPTEINNLPGSPTFPYPVLGSCPVTIANGAGQSVGYGCTTAGVGNSYNIAITNNIASQGGFNSYCDSSADSIYISGNLYYGGTSCPGTGSASSPSATCKSELGLLSQNNVIISYPLNSVLGEGTDTDGHWVTTQSDLSDSDNDNIPACGGNRDNNCESDSGGSTGGGCWTNDNDGDHSCNEDGSEYEGVWINWFSGGCNSGDAGESTNWACFDNEPGGCNDNCSYSNNENDINADTGPDGDSYWSSDATGSWMNGAFTGCPVGGNPGDGWDGDDNWVGQEPGIGSDPDSKWCNNDPGNSAGGGDWNYDADNDGAYSGATCTVGGAPLDPDGDGYCQGDTAPGQSDGDADDTVTGSGQTEMRDSGNGITTIDADIDAVWGSFMLDNYGYWSNADHSCLLTQFYFLATFKNEPSDDSTNCGTGGDNDGDEGTLGTVTINGAVSEFWRGILSHFDAYAGQFNVSGGYNQVNYNYDSRFLKGIPPELQGVGPPAWQASNTVAEASVCPTGTTQGGLEETRNCN